MDVAPTLLAIEEKLWRAAGARDAYAAHVALDAVHVFPGWGITELERVLESVAAVEPWETFTIDDQWDEEHMNVMLDEGGILTAVQSDPETCEEVRWGKRLAAVRVDLGRVDEETLAALLADAWEGKAPKRLLGS